MWKIPVSVTLENEITEEARQSRTFNIIESLPAGISDVDHWEQTVREVGFRTMRQLFTHGLELWDAQVVASYGHENTGCQWTKRGQLGLEIGTLFGKVQIKRQRLRCGHCGRWVVPLTDKLEMGSGRTTKGLRVPGRFV